MEMYASKWMYLHEYVIAQMKKNISPLVIVKNVHTEKFKADEDIIARNIFLTITYHRAMWQWLFDNPKETKKDFIKEFHITGLVVNSCFLCSYVDKHSTYIYDEDGFKTFFFNCALCPVKWPSSLTENQCLYSNEEYERDGLFSQFCRVRYNELVYSCDNFDFNSYLKSLSLAKRIRDLPLTDEVAAIFKSEGLK